MEVKESLLFLARNGCHVFVFTLSCFLAKFVIVNKERGSMGIFISPEKPSLFLRFVKE